ncbi:glycosyltransferase [Polynucleobacter sp. MG-28-Ekke-A2]|uniref:glycosyltransferase n=1 Tax=Polynucleobacter sp. MG-28-Ekke-A2 TaxID=3108276 RepID=UPI002B22FEA4|nr:glycosyltransferase [Polynucleobacter sp. MG-28-Ekke-A2]MEA9601199.1 glycosyltransferase [Polynucleobacter sp. MG-28-Ekke-A2]
MKIVLLASANSIHTQRWAISLLELGHTVTLITQHDSFDWNFPPNLRVIKLRFRGSLGYFLNSFALRYHLEVLQPDILNAHYASGYGTMASLVRYCPTLVSVWGGDVFDFPYQSKFKGELIRWNLRRANAVASTSKVMANQVSNLTPELTSAHITPFGVDCTKFSPLDNRNNQFITVGIVKTLEKKYGLDILIRAFSLLLGDAMVAKLDRIQRLRLVIAGSGSERKALEALVMELDLVNRVEFLGHIKHQSVPEILQTFDVFVAPSRLDSESFGVAVIEASASGLPVIVSNAGGLPEVVINGVTGLVVPRNNPKGLSDALHLLVLDPTLRLNMGERGRKHVLNCYEWNHCVDNMVSVYHKVIGSAKSK